MLERDYQARLIKKLRLLFPGCVILKNDTSYMQGVPDLLVLFEDKWAMLEVKESEDSIEQPNQRFYVQQFSEMSFGAFIYPSNEEEVLRDLQQAFGARRYPRLAKSE
jgi:hypothetical protein